MIRVNLFGPLWAFSPTPGNEGIKTTIFKLEFTSGRTVCKDILNKALSEVGLDMDVSELPDGVGILVNGMNIRFLEGLETIVEDGSVVAVIPIIAGG